MSDIPIIIFHLSYKRYAHISLKHNSLRNNIHFLTDVISGYSDVSDRVTLVDIKDSLSLLEDFSKIYVHASPNNSVLEQICIMRWVFIYNYMKSKDIKKAFICDSDVLIYDDINDVIPNEFFEDGCVLCTCPKHQNVTGGQSVWSLERLSNFVKFIYTFYRTQRENITKHVEMPRKIAGVSDMTLLYYFIHNRTEFVGLKFEDVPHPKYALNDVYVVPNSKRLTAFDLHLDTHGSHRHPNEWALDKTGRKVLRFMYGKPYGMNLRLKKWVQFSLLHFQGRNKGILEPVYEAGRKTIDYWMVHDKTFLKCADLTMFNPRIKEYDMTQENNLILNLLMNYPKNSIFIDVGAYNGNSSLEIAKGLQMKNRKDIKLICIEPNKHNCESIQSNINKHKLNIQIIQSVCSDTSGVVYMKSDEGSGTMYDNGFKGDAFPCNTLDNLVSTMVDTSSEVFLKVDVEGHEPQVLSGATRILKQTKHMYIKLWNDEHYLERHTKPQYTSHNKEVLNHTKDLFYPLQKIEKNVLFVNKKNI
jgi:FkbM family methyltransferase